MDRCAYKFRSVQLCLLSERRANPGGSNPGSRWIPGSRCFAIPFAFAGGESFRKRGTRKRETFEAKEITEKSEGSGEGSALGLLRTVELVHRFRVTSSIRRESRGSENLFVSRRREGWPGIRVGATEREKERRTH